MMMRSSAVSAFLASVVSTSFTNHVALADPTSCMTYRLCCEDVGCTNMCQMVDTCAGTAASAIPDNAEDICEQIMKYDCCRRANGCGDPHFTTWGEEVYDFHGECDLLFLKAPSFGFDVGMDIHVRTKIRQDYSFIESVALRIGNDILEVASWGEYFVNGVYEAAMPTELASFPVTRTIVPLHNKELVEYKVNVGEGQTITLKSFKDFVGVKLDNAFSDYYLDSVGLLGDFLTGKRLARNGTAIENDVEFGQEWQVLAEEPKLFQNAQRHPQQPHSKCVMPTTTHAQLQRKLEESPVSEEAAVEACAHWDEHFQEACKYDVLMTGDLGMADADAGAF